nr:MAG TPA: hypothetical protein [Caudoviricetes sp.]
MAQILIRTSDEMKNAVVNEAKRIGISTNALMAQILDEWKKKLKE